MLHYKSFIFHTCNIVNIIFQCSILSSMNFQAKSEYIKIFILEFLIFLIFSKLNNNQNN